MSATSEGREHQQALAAIAERRALVAAATPGLWLAVTGSGPKRRIQQHALVGQANMRGQGQAGCIAVFASIDGRKADDADLTAAAVNDFAALLNLAESVLARHAPDPEPIELMLHMEEECPTGECEEGDGHTVIVCRGCFPAWEDMHAHSVWPCADARAALAALGIEATDD